MLVNCCAISNLRYLVVGIIVEEGTGIQRKPPTHQHILGSDFEGIDELGLEGRAIINAGQLKNRENSELFINGQKYWIQIASFRSEEHTSELQSLMRISYAVFCLKKKNNHNTTNN